MGPKADKPLTDKMELPDASPLDRRHFALDAKRYRRFAKMLDASFVDNPRLRKLMATRAPWEK